MQSIALGTLCVLGAFAGGIGTAGEVHPFSKSEAALQHTTPGTSVRAGDANGNGVLDAGDISIILQAAEGLEEASAEELRRADTDGDYRLTVRDALRVAHDISLQ
jgi:hypothetical protein